MPASVGAGPLQNGVRCHEFEFLAAVDTALEAGCLHIARRRQRVPQPPRELEAGRGPHRFHIRVDMGAGIAADGAGMQIPEMRQVHQIVDHQHVIAFDRVDGVLVGPMRRIVVIGEIDDLGGVGQRRVTHPDPHQLVLLDRRIAAHPCVLRDEFLPGDRHAAPGRVENEAVIAALEAGLDKVAEMQRCGTMAAPVDKCRRLACAAAEQHDRIAADAAAERLLAELAGPRADIPSIAQQHGPSPRLTGPATRYPKFADRRNLYSPARTRWWDVTARFHNLHRQHDGEDRGSCRACAAANSGNRLSQRRIARDRRDPGRLVAFRRGLDEAGYVEGRNVAIEYRWAEGQYDQLPAFSERRSGSAPGDRDCHARRPLGVGRSGGNLDDPNRFQPGHRPSASGLIASLSRPGGNVTGVALLTAEPLESGSRAARIAAGSNRRRFYRQSGQPGDRVRRTKPARRSASARVAGARPASQHPERDRDRLCNHWRNETVPSS